MADKKGALFHWIVFGVIASLGLFFVLTSDFSLGQVKGEWHFDVLDVYYEVQKEQLLLDSNIREILKESTGKVSLDTFRKGFGCGFFDDSKKFPLLNKNEKFCEFKLDDQFKNVFKKDLDKAHPVKNYNLSFKDGYIVGDTNFKFNHFSMSDHYIYYEELFNFKIKEDKYVGKYLSLFEEARFLVTNCINKNSEELVKCVEENRSINWEENDCLTETDKIYENRRFPFCVSLDENKYYFALDFNPSEIISSKNQQVSYDPNDNIITLNFEKVESVTSFKIYYTNWLEAKSSIPNNYENVFFGMPTTNFKNTINLMEVPKEENCPENKELNIIYLCKNNYFYSFNKDIVEESEEYLFTVTTVFENKESKIGSFNHIKIE